MIVYCYRRLKEFKHRFFFKNSYENQRIAYDLFKISTSRKSNTQIRKELEICQNYWKCYPLHYFRYRLYETSKNLTAQELINYIPEFFFYSLYLPYFNTSKFSILLNDKNVTDVYFRGLGINTPHTIVKIIKGQLHDRDQHSISETCFNAIIKSTSAEKLFVKPADGQGGFGIIVFKKIGSTYVCEDKVLSYEYMKHLAAKNDWIIQEGIAQDEALSRIQPASVNTFRIATRNMLGKITILCATLRMSRDVSQVDNSAQGGIVLPLNVETGECGERAFTELGEPFIKHPMTGFTYKGSRIAQWQLVREFVFTAATKLSPFTFLGWDIALSNKSPLAIEANLNFGLDHYQQVLGGLRELFEIDDPSFYWKSLLGSQINMGVYSDEDCRNIR